MTTRTVSESFTAEELADLDRAASAYRNADDYLWDFAPLAADIVGRRDGMTAELARRIKRSPDTIENFALAFKLWAALLRRYPSPAEVWRAELYISHFVPVARRWASKWISLDDAANLLALAVRDGLSVEQLRSKLPGNDRTDSAKMMSRYIKSLDRDFIHAPRLGVPASVIRAAKLLRGRLERAK